MRPFLQFQPVIIHIWRHLHTWLAHELGLCEWSIVHFMVNAMKFPRHTRHIRVQPDEHLRLRLRAFFCVEVTGVSTGDQLRNDLVLQEGVELDRAPAVFEHAKIEVCILVISASPAIGHVVAYEVARVNALVDGEGWEFVLAWAKAFVVGARHSDIEVTKGEVFHCGEASAIAHRSLEILVQSVKAIDVIIHYPMPLVPVSYRVIPDKVASRAGAFAFRVAQVIASLVAVLILLIEHEYFARVYLRSVTIAFLFLY